MHARAQDASMPFGNTGDQVGGPSGSQRGRKATDDRGDHPIQRERLQGFINRSAIESLPRDVDVSAAGIAGMSDLALLSACLLRTTPM